MSSPVPLICCGMALPQTLASKATILPEYDFIHICLGTEQALADLPQLLNGSVPANNEQNIGSKDYSKPAVGVVFGGYNDAQFEEVQRACGDMSSVPWLRLDPSQPIVPMGPEFGKIVAGGRLKKVLKELEAEGKFGQPGTYLF